MATESRLIDVRDAGLVVDEVVNSGIGHTIQFRSRMGRLPRREQALRDALLVEARHRRCVAYVHRCAARRRFGSGPRQLTILPPLPPSGEGGDPSHDRVPRKPRPNPSHLGAERPLPDDV
jgi:hypothetical protein